MRISLLDLSFARLILALGTCRLLRCRILDLLFSSVQSIVQSSKHFAEPQWTPGHPRWSDVGDRQEEITSTIRLGTSNRYKW